MSWGKYKNKPIDDMLFTFDLLRNEKLYLIWLEYVDDEFFSHSP